MTEAPIRVGEFISQYPYPHQFEGTNQYYCSGGERVAREVSIGLAEQGCDVHVFTSAAGLKYEQRVQNGVTVHRSPSIAKVNTTQIAPTLPISGLSSDLDIVHAHNTTPPGILSGWLYALAHDVPFVITHHGGERYDPHKSLFRRIGLAVYTKGLIQPVFRRAAVAVTPSAGFVEESTVLSDTRNEVRTIPNGVDVSHYDLELSKPEAKRQLGIDSGEFVYLFMGAHHQRKGIQVLIEAFDRAVDEVEGGSLIVTGSGQLSGQLRERAAALGLKDIIQFPGFIPENRKPLYMTAADVFVLPSTIPSSEVYPLVLLEAAAGGTPVIVSDFPTLRSVVSTNDFGVLVEPNDQRALATALVELYENDDLRARLAEAARQTAVAHSWHNIATQYRMLFKEILSGT